MAINVFTMVTLTRRLQLYCPLMTFGIQTWVYKSLDKSVIQRSRTVKQFQGRCRTSLPALSCPVQSSPVLSCPAASDLCYHLFHHSLRSEKVAKVLDKFHLHKLAYILLLKYSPISDIAQHWKQHHQVELIWHDQNDEEEYFYLHFYKNRKKCFRVCLG